MMRIIGRRAAPTSSWRERGWNVESLVEHLCGEIYMEGDWRLRMHQQWPQRTYNTIVKEYLDNSNDM